MPAPSQLTRRRLLQSVAASAAAAALPRAAAASSAPAPQPLQEFGYHQIAVRGTHQLAQRDNVLEVLMGLNEDSLLYPFRAMSASSNDRPAASDAPPPPGKSLPGWYEWYPHYDFHHDANGLAPGHSFGQWTSALARFHAASTFVADAPGNPALKARALRLNTLMAEAIGPGFFEKSLFAGYTFDKLLCGLMDAHRLLADSAAFPALDRLTDAATPSLPGRAVMRETAWKLGAGTDRMWDETYTMPENLFLVSTLGAGPRYRRMAEAYLEDSTYFAPLVRGENALADRHAYSYVNALCSAMQAWLTGGSAMHLQAAENAFTMLEAQSFATGGWGPMELLRKPGYDELITALTTHHNGFETPCGAYAHMKLTRYLLRATRNGGYGDSMERVMFNTVLGALPLQPDGQSFYHQDLNYVAKRAYNNIIWPCCAGSLPQVVADYGINTYLHELGAVWVNLYQPSELRWTEGAHTLSLEQTGDYLQDGKVRIRVTASTPTAFALKLRIPAWSGPAAALLVNGRPTPIALDKGFTTLSRTWRTGDVVELETAPSLRLEALPANGGPAHADLVALLHGPLVLFAIRELTETGPLKLSREALLKATRTGPLEWTVFDPDRPAAPRRFVPFTELGDRTYTTYLNAT